MVLKQLWLLRSLPQEQVPGPQAPRPPLAQRGLPQIWILTLTPTTPLKHQVGKIIFYPDRPCGAGFSWKAQFV